MSESEITCKNCENEFDANFEFCPFCGQKVDEQLTLGVLFYNTISNYFSFDARFFKSFIPLMTRPGYLASKFIGGKRLLYLHPAQMYLFISVIFFFVFSFVTREQTQKLDTALKTEFEHKQEYIDSIKQAVSDSVKVAEVNQKLKDSKVGFQLDESGFKVLDSIKSSEDKKVVKTGFNFNQEAIDSLIASGASDEEIYKEMGMDDDNSAFSRRLYHQALKFYKNRSGGSILQAFYDSIPISMFILLPIFALILKVFFYRKGKYAHHLVFTFYFFSFLFMVFSILVICNLIWKGFPGWINSVIMFSTFFYLWIAIKRFYGQGWFVCFLKSSTISFAFLLFVIPLAVIVMGLTAFLFY
ncbi:MULTISPECIES: DUF3667 domain-containing protein [Mangrovimonas]|uniref:DUF3667 domain-containing protein n=1 Tax=Mangrovimonas TaxID=1211036 RepID=UPI0006B578F6|nr:MULTISPECIES: DUF3667 domain-containing protein [Mangrovimonas]OMP30628.1 hypothetical protein BKM32_10315 [Mangrovimonas sp. DI 80]